MNQLHDRFRSCKAQPAGSPRSIGVFTRRRFGDRQALRNTMLNKSLNNKAHQQSISGQQKFGDVLTGIRRWARHPHRHAWQIKIAKMKSSICDTSIGAQTRDAVEQQSNMLTTHAHQADRCCGRWCTNSNNG
jgi:hypothetical protein